MNPPFRWFIGLALMAVGVIILMLANSCSHCHNCYQGLNEASHISSESWSQDNLKQFDSGCPTAIYVNNRYGFLELCP